MQIDETKLPESLVVTNEDGTKTIDYSKIKTVTDVENVLKAKTNANNELSALKEKFKDVDIERYKQFIANQNQANKDVLQNPVFKNLNNQFTNLQNQYNNLQNELKNRDQAILDGKLKDEIRKFDQLAATAVDDVFFRLKADGFTLSENGKWLSKDGKEMSEVIESYKQSSPHLFKRSHGSNGIDPEQLKKLQQAGKTRNIDNVLKQVDWSGIFK